MPQEWLSSLWGLAAHQASAGPMWEETRPAQTVQAPLAAGVILLHRNKLSEI